MKRAASHGMPCKGFAIALPCMPSKEVTQLWYNQQVSAAASLEGLLSHSHTILMDD
jgi:hypothetical protein